MSEAKKNIPYTFLEGLNERQLEAVTSTEGYIRVIAGAGSGKTRALASRFAYLVTVLGVSPKNILCVTFTNKAAQEMRNRIRIMTGSDDMGIISTFHGVCAQIIREDHRVVNFPPNFTIIDEDERKLIMKKVMDELHIDSRQLTIRSLLQHLDFRKKDERHRLGTDFSISMLMDEDMTKLRDAFLSIKPDDYYIDDYYDYDQYLKDKAYVRFLFYQRRNFGLDFTDLMNFALYMLQSDVVCCNKWQHQLQYVMVDEFQDVSKRQYDFVRILTDYHKNLFVVGDPDQTIYTWRGAKVRYIIDFGSQFPNSKTIMMMQNYRSTNRVITAANALIKKNKLRIPKDILGVSTEVGSALYFHAKDRRKEAEWISNEITMLHDKGAKYQDIMILYRMHTVTKHLEEVLMERKIPYRIFSGIPFYSRAEIKDIIAYLRLAVNPKDNLSFERAIQQPPRNVGKRRIDFLQTFSIKNKCSMLEALKLNIDNELFETTEAAEFLAVMEKLHSIANESCISDLLTSVLTMSGYEKMLRSAGEDERLENLSVLKQSIVSLEEDAHEMVSVVDYLNNVALLTNQDAQEKNKDEVSLMTVHTSKGLEAPFVFVYALNEKIFPSAQATDNKSMEEERRLAYVAFTRAKKQLFLSEAEIEETNAQSGGLFPSRFIFETEHENLEYVVELSDSLIDQSISHINTSKAKQIEKMEDAEEFQIGERIAHSMYGHGTIRAIDKVGQVYSIQFDKYETERNIRIGTPLTLLETNSTHSRGKEKKEYILRLSDDRDSATKVIEGIDDQVLLSIYNSVRIERPAFCARSLRYAALKIKLCEIFGANNVEEVTIEAEAKSVDFGDLTDMPSQKFINSNENREPIWGEETQKEVMAKNSPVEAAPSDFISKLKELKELFDLGILTEEEFVQEKQKVLANRK